MRYKQSTPPIFYVINRIKQTMSIEYYTAQNNNKLNVHLKKWETIKNGLNPSSSEHIRAHFSFNDDYQYEVHDFVYLFGIITLYR